MRLKNASGENGSCTCHSLRSEEHTSELQSQSNLVCRLLLEKKNISINLATMNSFPTEATAASDAAAARVRNRLTRTAFGREGFAPCIASRQAHVVYSHSALL